MFVMLVGVVFVSLFVQVQGVFDVDLMVMVFDILLFEVMIEGFEVKGIILVCSGDWMQVIVVDGICIVIIIIDVIWISVSKGFFGFNCDCFVVILLFNGFLVFVKMMQGGSGLVVSWINLQNKDLCIVLMIYNGIEQGFVEQIVVMEVLCGCMVDIDQYNIKGMMNVNFDIGKVVLLEQVKVDFCVVVIQVEGMKNVLLLVVGYIDLIGSVEFNQVFSERWVSCVVNFLQQICGWKFYCMLIFIGMFLVDLVVSNDMVEGKVQNCCVVVNIMVSKGFDGL